MKILIKENQIISHSERLLNDPSLTFFEQTQLSNIINGKVAYVYHGTNRDFDEFSYEEIRKWRSDRFLGNGVFLTCSQTIAKKYANANANKELSLNIIKKAYEINKDLGDFMSSLYYKGNITWQLPKFRKIIDNWQFSVDPNDVAELVNLIPNSQSLKDYNKDQEETHEFYDIFSTSHNALADYQIEYLKELRIGDFRPKLYIVKIMPTKSVLVSNNKNEIKNSKYDIVIAYDVDDILEDKPEIIVKNLSLLQIMHKKIIE